MKKALILIDEEWQAAEVIYPYYRLIEAGYETFLVAEKAGVAYTAKGGGYSMVSDLEASLVVMNEYEIVIIPGGNAPDKMRCKESMVQLVKQAFLKDKVIGAICHGPSMLIEADVLRESRVTCYRAIKQDVVNAGAVFEDAPVVADGNLITSRKPDDLPMFMKEVLLAAES